MKLGFLFIRFKQLFINLVEKTLIYKYKIKKERLNTKPRITGEKKIIFLINISLMKNPENGGIPPILNRKIRINNFENNLSLIISFKKKILFKCKKFINTKRVKEYKIINSNHTLLLFWENRGQ